MTIRSEGDKTMEGDRLDLVSVLFNLLDNALKYTAEKPVIDVNIQGAGTSLQLTVSDNGIGIPQEYHQRVFEKFFRVPHGDVHNAKGYGLGLSYVSHIVEQHKGSIKIEPNEGGGCRFIISLPGQPS